MTQGEQAVLEARSWLGTPYRHQASLKGAGADCLGLLRGVWRALYGAEPVSIPPYTADWSEASGREELLQAAARLLKPAGPNFSVGDVLVFRMRLQGVAKHLGIVSQGGASPRFIHAYSGHGVVDVALTAPWQRRIAARLSFP
jgi:NlpC/P60 family putative phage cell wall peptidase